MDFLYGNPNSGVIIYNHIKMVKFADVLKIEIVLSLYMPTTENNMQFIPPIEVTIESMWGTSC